jgi:sulfatase modifying factor 1
MKNEYDLGFKLSHKFMKAKTVIQITDLILISFIFYSCDAILTLQWSLAHIQKRDMVAITGGTYTQTDGTNSFTHNISSFQLAKYEVTYELWYAVYEWAIGSGYSFANPGREGSNGIIGAPPTDAKWEPVTTVSWRDAIVWCNAYSETAYLTPCYRYGGAVVKDSTDANATACDNAVCDWGVNGFRLPSEGEWQFAASDKGVTPWNYAAGATTYYNDISDTNPANGIVDGKDANDLVAVYGAYWSGSGYISTGIMITADVGTKLSNELSIFDMSGNVLEMCWDYFAPYPGGSTTDYRGPTTGIQRTSRGGAFNASCNTMYIGFRGVCEPHLGDYSTGLRVARSH